jgi:hypothetical protein
MQTGRKGFRKIGYSAKLHAEINFARRVVKTTFAPKKFMDWPGIGSMVVNAHMGIVGHFQMLVEGYSRVHSDTRQTNSISRINRFTIEKQSCYGIHASIKHVGAWQ